MCPWHELRAKCAAYAQRQREGKGEKEREREAEREGSTDTAQVETMKTFAAVSRR